MTKSIMLLL